jgi:hypothetical protein
MYDMIWFTPDSARYAPPSIVEEFRQEFGLPRYLSYDKVDIPMGKSRVGGPVVDLPPGLEYPDELFFTAQFDMTVFSLFDKTGLLPRSGFLYFFYASRPKERGAVLHADVDRSALRRVVREHDKDFFSGRLVRDVFGGAERFSLRFRPELADEHPQGWEARENEISKRWGGDPEWGTKLARDHREGWDSLAGADLSKLLGIYTNVQCHGFEVQAVMSSGKTELLQIGENFTGEGILNVLIPTRDLERGDFSNCEFEWNQG